LISEVLEHLPSPGDAVREIHRVLKPGGHVILTTPLFWPLHEQPRDYYRFTKFGLQFLFERSGLRVLEVAELTGFLATFAQLGCYFLWSGFGQGKAIRILMFPLIWLLQRVGFWLNKLDKTHEFSCANIVIGQKP
jgi:SAM-dependent methyltransferase